MLKKSFLVLFISVCIILYILFIFFTQYVPVKELKYIGILLCVLFSFIIANKSVDTWTVRIALIFTAIADLFLLLMIGYELIGVITFSIVQLVYALRLMLMNNKKVYQTILFRLALIIIFEVIAVTVVNNYDALFLVTSFYLANLITNVVLAFYYFKLNKVFAFGLLLFLCCDLFVGLYNAYRYLNFSSHTFFYKLLNQPIDLMWFFYFPSQVLITLSIFTFKRQLKDSESIP